MNDKKKFTGIESNFKRYPSSKNRFLRNHYFLFPFMKTQNKIKIKNRTTPNHPKKKKINKFYVEKEIIKNRTHNFMSPTNLVSLSCLYELFLDRRWDHRRKDVYCLQLIFVASSWTASPVDFGGATNTKEKL
jgi:hypothetical protein